MTAIQDLAKKLQLAYIRDHAEELIRDARFPIRYDLTSFDRTR